MRRIAIVTAVVSLILASITAAVASITTPAGEVDSHGVAAPGDAGREHGNLPDNDRARGVVFDGLRPAGPGSDCAGGFEMDVDGETLCTHGPDAAPGNVDVREPRSVAQLKLQTLSLPTVANPNAAEHAPLGGDPEPDTSLHVHADGTAHDHGVAAADPTSGTAAEPGIVPVIGDGTSGNRVIAVYAVAADRPDRYEEIAPLIANWAAHVDAMVNQSAGLTGGERHVRFVTDSAGSLVVEKMILPADGDDTFGNTIAALKNAGYNDPARKYLIWTDANLYCGIATIYSDDKPTQDNYNNGRFAQYARVDAGCWGHSNSVELHEMIHNMGGVQKTAPHTTPGWHCTDDYDRMCYKDSAEVVMTYTCPPEMEALLDCGHDDYFHSSPPSGSYLADHWNVADSSFLHAGPVDGDPPPQPPPPTNEPPTVSASAPATITVGDGAALDGTVTDDGLDQPITTTWSGPAGVTFDDAAAEDTTARFPEAGTYTLTLTAWDGEFNVAASVTITVEDPIVNQAPVVAVSAAATVTLGTSAGLNGTVTDDGPYTVVWTAMGPGAVAFADPTAEVTTASFSAAGVYDLTLTADDGDQTGSDTVTITVEEPEATPPPPPDPDPTPVTETFSGSLNKKWPARTFDTTVDAGEATATLTFDGGRSKKARGMELTINVYDGSGNPVFGAEGTPMTATGTSPVTLTVTLPAATYTWEVTGARTSFTLVVRYMKL
jgi:hypothetical protein